MVPTVVTKREAGMKMSTGAQTPGDLPNVHLIAMPAYQRVLVRAGRVYMQSVVGFLGTSLGGILPEEIRSVLPVDFAGQLLLAAQLAIAPAVVSLLHNATELLTKLDESNPTWRG